MNKYLQFPFLFSVLLLIITFTVSVKAQEVTSNFSDDESNEIFPYSEPFQLLNYNWEISPVSSKLGIEESKEEAIFQKYHYALEYFYDEKGDFKVWELTHHIIKINSENTLKQYNKVFVPLQEGEKLVSLKARSIQIDGKIIEIDLSQIRKIEENGFFASSTRFPIEGAQVGSDIEYFYVVERSASFSGHYMYPANIILKNVSFELITPANILFVSKSYNGLPQAKQQSDAMGRNLLSILSDKIHTASSKSILGEGSLMRLHYRFSHVLADEKYADNSWENIANQLASVVYPLSLKDENRRINSILEELGANKTSLLSQEQKIKAIEDYIKNHIRIDENVSHDSYSLLTSLETGMSDSYGVLRLFGAFFQNADIDHRLVGTSDKKYFTFDESFPSWDFIHSYLFYFPSLKSYLMPTEINYRYGYIPYSLINNKGIFVKPPVILGEDIIAYSDIRTIDFIPAQSHTNTYYKVSFEDNLNTTKINLKRELTGYSAIDYHAYYYLSDEPEKAVASRFDIRAAEQIIPEHVDITTIENHYYDAETVRMDLFKVEGKISSNTLVEQADETYLFKLGSLLDAHPKSYTQKGNVEKDYPEEFKTVIEIEIPEGYYIRNFESLKKQVWNVEMGQMLMHFKTEATIKNGILTVEIIEFYRDGIQTKEQLAAFERINAASVNFSNTVVMIQKMK
ncbi:hypothetical protein Fleli_1745 [Bernardetia litoralis DSM 6794]|uniref:DUF3857 domain-containing protein n=1 Tax=Bernardetia litoralis (strain ATCC 23117 / DSM 6794 / NBRC 15988 / NCIMB 1366 / Fx l1 / Sio-4) TaxID=880071 RepID=I4AJK9_BERLS|nr:DUF3857 domain-containing protein [Bernardetia litoralis]AFM04144.1 hypothetical protein Fleli_1745 [Bernardetia litoralis DSM 6794]